MRKNRFKTWGSFPGVKEERNAEKHPEKGCKEAENKLGRRG